MGRAVEPAGLVSGLDWASVAAVSDSPSSASPLPGSRSRNPEAPPAAPALRRFDAAALYAAVDVRRGELGLSWPAVTQAIWETSAILNARRGDHPIAVTTVTGMATSGRVSCQHALFFLRWLDAAPEEFLAPSRPLPAPAARFALPTADAAHRLRFDLAALAAALGTARTEKGLTLRELAALIRATESQLRGLGGVRFAVNMGLVMRCTQWLRRPAADFVMVATW